MAFTIDFATGSASTKVGTLTKQVEDLTKAANTASQALENSFKRGSVAKTTAESIKPISKQVAGLSKNLESLNIAPLQALYATLKNPIKSTKELQGLSDSVFKLSRTLPQIDERNLEALFSVLKRKPKSVGELHSLAGSFMAISQALPYIQPTPIRKLFNALEKYKPIGGDLEKLGKGFESIAKSTPNINAQPISALFKALEGYKPIGGELQKIGTGFKAIAKSTPDIDVGKVRALMDALAAHKFNGAELRVIANSISLIGRSTEKLNSKPLADMFKVISSYPRVTKEINDLAQALKNLSAAQSKANSAAMKKMVGEAMGGNTNAAKLAGFSAEQLKIIQSVADKHKALAEAKANVGRKATEANTHMKGFIKSLNVSEQSSASLRAGMNALGTHMGIFTGRTIAVATAVYTTISAFRSMITTGTEFTKEMVRATAVMNATANESVMLENRVRELARETVFTGVQVAQGLTYLGMAGLTSSEAMAALEPTLNIAKIGMIEFSEAADIVTNVLRAFKLNAEDLSGVADDLATSITNSNATIQQLAKALSYVAPIAYAAGGGIREVTALLTVMHDVGIKSSRAGTALRRAYGNLLAPTAKVSKTLEKLKVSTYDANGRMRSMVSIFLDLSNAGATSADVMNLFGVRASSALQSILDDINSVNPKLREMMKLLAHNEGAAKDLGQAFEEYLGADAQKLVSALQDKFIEIFKVNEEGFRKIVKDLTEFIKTLDAQKIGAWVDRMVEVVKWMYEFREAIAYTSATILASPLVAVFGAALVKVGRGIWWLLKMLARFVPVLVNVATKLNPVVAAISAIGTAAYFAYDAYVDVNSEAEKSAKIHENNADAIKKEIERREELYNKMQNSYRNVQQGMTHTDPKFSDATRSFMNPQEEYVIDNVVTDRMETIYAKQVKSLDAIKANVLAVKRSSEAWIGALTTMGWKSEVVNKEMAHHKKLVNESEAALEDLAKAYNKLQNQIGDAFMYNVLPEDIPKRQEFEKSTIEIMNAKDYDARETRFNELADLRIAEIERLRDLEQISDEVATKRMQAIERGRYGSLISDVEEQLSKEREKLVALRKRYNVNEDGTVPNLAQSMDTGEDIKDTKELGNTALLQEQREAVLELESTLKSLRLEAGETGRELKHAFIVDTIKEADFEGAVDDLKQYNSEVDTSIKKVKAEITAIETGNKVREDLLNKTEMQALTDADALILKQKLAIATLENANADQKVIDKLKEKMGLLVKERDLLEGKLGTLGTERGNKEDAQEYKDEIERLKRLRFLPKEQQVIESYDEDHEDLDKYFTMVKGYEATALEDHQDYLDAKLALDWEYFEAAMPIYAELFESVSSEMQSALTDAIVYGATWEDVAGRIRNALFEGVVNALVAEGIELAKVGLMKVVMSQREIAAEGAVTAAKIANKTSETTAQVAGITTVSVAEKAASTSAGTSIAGLVGAGAELAAAWSAAAVNVSTATFGQAALAGSSALAAAQSLNMATSIAMSAAGAAAGVGASVAGRKNGGHVSAGQPYLVGEESAEVFVPDRAGTIITERQNKQKGSPFGGGGEDSRSGQEPRDLKIINAIDPEFIKDYLASSEGEEIIINHIHRNKGVF